MIVLLLLPLLTLQSFSVQSAQAETQFISAQAGVSNSHQGLLEKAKGLSLQLADQSLALTATNPWHRLVNEQIAYALKALTYSESGAVRSQTESTVSEIRRRRKILDDLAELLTFIQSNEGLPGSTVFSVSTLTVGSRAKFSQSYRLPTKLPTGAVIVIGSHEEQPFSFQTIDPQASNFVSVSVSGLGVARFELEAHSMTRGSGERQTTKVYPAIRITEGELSRGETVTVSYQNFQVPTIAQTQFTLPLYILNPGLSLSYGVPTEGIRLAADTGVFLRANAPSIVRQNQNFEISTELTDRYGNLSSSETPSLDLLVNGVFQQRLQGSNDSVRSISLSLDKLGISRLEMRSGGGGIRTLVNPINVIEPSSSQQSDYQLHWVDLHRRTMAGQGLYTNEDIASQQLSLQLSLVTNQALNMSQQSRDEQTLDGGIIGFELDQGLHNGGNAVVLATGLAPFLTLENRILALEGTEVGSNVIHMAVADAPTDVRAFNPRSGRLVEVISNNAVFESFGIRHAMQGNRIGFTGTSGSKYNNLNTPAFNGLTAVWVKRGETLFDALLQSRTYVTSGAKIYLEVEVNEGMPGSRVQHQKSRVVSGRVAGTNGILAVELLKNGLIIDRISFGSLTDRSQQAKLDQGADSAIRDELSEPAILAEPEQQLRVSFYSSSGPALDQIDYPRNGREWIGYLKFSGSEIQSVSAPGFGNSARQGVAIHPREEARVDFITWTRGQASSYLVDADFSDDNAVIELNLKGGQEDRVVEPMLRNPASFLGSRQLLTVAELRNGSVERTIEVDGYRDVVSFELVYKDLPAEQTFSFQEGAFQNSKSQFNQSQPTRAQDSSLRSSRVKPLQVKSEISANAKNLKAGDFYYVRVIQVDDQIALSSPVWVGGFDISR
ncbi:MAG: hypothetical protein ACJAVI_001725 [Candidatus Azotimanducaceae bacterium]|jgi:hypothetical protein